MHRRSHFESRGRFFEGFLQLLLDAAFQVHFVLSKMSKTGDQHEAKQSTHTQFTTQTDKISNTKFSHVN